MKQAQYKKSMPKQSVLGAISLIIGTLNTIIVIHYIYRLSIWLKQNKAIMANPKLIEGIQVPEKIVIIINFLIVSTIIGLLVGLVGISIKRKSFFPIIGVLLNCSLLLVIILKYLV